LTARAAELTRGEKAAAAAEAAAAKDKAAVERERASLEAERKRLEEVGPDRYRSPRSRMPCNVGSTCV
jgi:hypothetical protein